MLRATFVYLLLAPFIAFSSLSSAASGAASGTKKTPVNKACVAVVNACKAGGFVIGRGNKHPGVGMWAGCVRPLSKGIQIPGVKGASKEDALGCLKTRKSMAAGRV